MATKTATKSNKTNKSTKKTETAAAKTAKKTTAAKSAAPAKKTNVKTTKAKSPATIIIGAIVAGVVLIAAVIGVTLFVDSLNKGPKAGRYTLSALKANGEDQTDSLSLISALGLTAELELKDDKTCSLNLFGDENPCTYTKDTITFDGDTTPFTYNDSTITFTQENNEMSFTLVKE